MNLGRSMHYFREQRSIDPPWGSGSCMCAYVCVRACVRVRVCVCVCVDRSGSVVECLTRDPRAAGSSLTGVTALCP